MTEVAQVDRSFSFPAHSPSPALVQAALDCFVTFGIAKTSLTDVAKRAGVSRATAYRAFENKDKLVDAIIVHEVDRFMDALDEAVEWSEPLVVALQQAVEFALDYLSRHSLLQHVLISEPEQLTSAVITQDGQASLTEVLMPALVERFAQTHHSVLQVPVEQAVEWLIRMTTSLLLSPSSRMPDSRAIATLLLRGLTGDVETVQG